ncbi:MAG: hemerythrin domain-containing protein [Polyangiaceae bacterium]
MKNKVGTAPKKKPTKRARKPAPLSPLEDFKSVVRRVVGRAVERAAAADESATRLLKRQHDEVKALFERFEKAKSRSAKIGAFNELAANLVAHDAIEREIFYPACERKMKMTPLLGEALVEHGLIEFSLHQADRAQQKADFEFKCQVLKEVVEHHVKEEERDFFPEAEKALGYEALLALGQRMKVRFDEQKGRDFREPLRHNLKQVLAGVLEPSPKSQRRSKRQSKRAA